MLFSIIIATRHGEKSIGETLRSLALIKLTDDVRLQIVIVDQSFNALTFDVAREFMSRVNIVYVHALRAGLSSSRNIGLDIAEGEVICFADDDCTYSQDVFLKVSERFKAEPVDMIGAGVYDPESLALTRYTRYSQSQRLTAGALGGRITSISIFVRRSVRSEQLRFNERLGLGAKFQSCEEIDFVYRLITSGGRGLYCPEIQIFHHDDAVYDAGKTERYAAGHGAFTKILLGHGDFISITLGAKKILMALGRLPGQILTRRRLYPLAYWRGYCRGLFGYSLKKSNAQVLD